MKKRLLSLVLAAVMAVGISVPAMAYSTPDFSDVPSNHWAYTAIMEMADAGVIKGMGNGIFAPEDKLTAEMFVVLVGRVVFPNVKAEGSDWSGPYVAEAKNKGLLTGTNVNDATLKGEISRYDMAVILSKSVELLKVEASKADSSKVADYGDIPNRYTDAVLTVYGSGLIQGDQNGNFNGTNSMNRQEAATVMSRLTALAPSSSNPGGTITDSGETPPPSTTTEPETPTTVTTEAKYAIFAEAGCAPRRDYDPSKVERVEGTGLWIDTSFKTPEVKGTSFEQYVYFNVGDTYQFTVAEVPRGYGYSEGDLNERVQYWLDQMIDDERAYQSKKYTNGIWSSSNPSVATVDENGLVTIVGPGEATIQAQVPVIYYRDSWTQKSDYLLLLVDP